MRRVLILALASTTALVATPASASLVYDPNPPVAISAQGFGNVPRDLTVQATGNATSESGCVAVAAGGGITFGSSSCISNGSVHDSNGVANTGNDEPPPLDDNQKYGIPSITDLGWASAADIGILFNATDPAGDSVNLLDLTLKFYNATTGALITAIDGSYAFDGTETGNGSAGFVFDVDAAEQTFLNTLIFNQLGTYGGASNIRMALEASISDSSSGPESFTIFNLHSPPVPEPATWAMMLLGFGGIGLALRRSRRRGEALMQIA
jgi:hypothetical protein